MHKIDRSVRGQWVTRIFSAKEAFYKWQYPLTGCLLEFQDVAINIEESCTSFKASCISAEHRHTEFRQAQGKYLIEQQVLISVVV